MKEGASHSPPEILHKKIKMVVQIYEKDTKIKKLTKKDKKHFSKKKTCDIINKPDFWALFYCDNCGGL